MLVTDRHLVGEARLVDTVVRAVAGGVDAVQLRERDLDDAAYLGLARRLQAALGERATLLVNGRPHVARALGAGLHLPEAAPSPPPGPWPLWGRAVHSPGAAATAAAEGAGYLLAGPVFATASKPGAIPLGLAGFRQVVAAAGGVPVLAIGGVVAAGVRALRAAGAAGVAVRGAILTAPDPTEAARRLRVAWEER